MKEFRTALRVNLCLVTEKENRVHKTFYSLLLKRSSVFDFERKLFAGNRRIYLKFRSNVL